MCPMSSSDEYQQVAALLAMDVQTTYMAAKNHPEMALDLLEMLDMKREQLINDPKYREMRYNATRTVFAVTTK